MKPELSRRLGLAIGSHLTEVEERNQIVGAAVAVDEFEQLPDDVQALVEEIEGRPVTEGAAWMEPMARASLRANAPKGSETASLTELHAHFSCRSGQFCRNPLHPGPCKGWKKSLPGYVPPAPRKRAAKKAAPATAPAPTPAAPAPRSRPVAPAPTPTPANPLTPGARVLGGDFTSVTQVGPQGGSNPGGVFQAADGSKYYIKAASSEQWAREQALAADLYALAGVPTPKIVIGKGAPIPGSTGFQTATEIVPGLSAPAGTPKFKKALQDGFAVDAWLADWDIGQHGNAMTDAAGNPIRMDIGGSLRFRARGGSKGAAFGGTVGEWTTMRDTKNVSGPLFKGMDTDQLIASGDRVTAISDAAIRAAVAARGLDSGLADTLIKRRDDIKKKVDILKAAKANTGLAPTFSHKDHIADDEGVAFATSVATAAKAFKPGDTYDPHLRAAADAVGFSNPPQVQTAIKVGQLGKAGSHELIFRGVTASYQPDGTRKPAQQIHEQMRTGGAYYGRGIYGNGYYFTTAQGTARSYSDKTAGSTVRAAIPLSQMKLIQWTQLSNEWQQFINKLPANDVRRTAFHNPAVYAIARGYDAIEVPQGQRRMGVRSETYYVILNRTVMTVTK